MVVGRADRVPVVGAARCGTAHAGRGRATTPPISDDSRSKPARRVPAWSHSPGRHARTAKAPDLAWTFGQDRRQTRRGRPDTLRGVLLRRSGIVLRTGLGAYRLNARIAISKRSVAAPFPNNSTTMPCFTAAFPHHPVKNKTEKKLLHHGSNILDT